MMKKRLISFILIATMTLAMFGCGNKTDKEKEEVESGVNTTVAPDSTEAPEVVEPYTVSMLYADNANYPFSNDWMIIKLIEEHTGATLDIQPVPDSDYETKKQIIFNSGSIPDIVTKSFAKPSDAAAGLLLPINQYEDMMPNYKAWIEKYGLRDELNRTTFADGNYYTLPTNSNRTKLQNHIWMIRTDIFEKNNIPVPTTLDEVYEAGLKLKEIYPDSTPITNRFGSGNLMAGIASGFGTIAGWTIGDGAYYNNDKDTWEFAPTTDNWKNMLEYTKKMYEAGVLDQEFGTLDSTVYEQRVVQGQTFILYDWAENSQRYNKDGVANDPDFNVAPIFPPEGNEGKYPLQWTSTWTMGWILPASLAEKDNFEQILKFIDWFYTDEAEEMLSYGIEGETFEIKDGIRVFLDENTDYCATYGLNNNSLTVLRHPDLFTQAFGDKAQSVKEIFDQMAEKNCVPNVNPASPLTPQQLEDTAVVSTSLTDYANMMMENFIYGKESLDNWDKFVKECEAKGSVELLNLYNQEWAKRSK